jgi:hypothetical protein
LKTQLLFRSILQGLPLTVSTCHASSDANNDIHVTHSVLWDLAHSMVAPDRQEKRKLYNPNTRNQAKSIVDLNTQRELDADVNVAGCIVTR